MAKPSTLINRRHVLLASASGALALTAGGALAQPSEQTSASAKAGFSFAVYGNSRPMMYLPSNEGNPDLTQLFVEMFGLVMPDKVAAEVVKKDVKLIFDPATKELIQIVMPFMTKTEVMTLTVDKGWVTEASVEDVKLLPGVHRVMFRLQGGDWVAREIVRDVNAGRAEFVVNSGDVVWWGNQGRTVSDSPYWKRVNDTMLSQLPAPDSEMLAAGLEGRWFIGVGNHEVWGDPKIEGVLSAVPYLKKLGVTPERLIYTVRLQRRSLHLSLERQVRLSIALAMGCGSAEIRGADAADAGLAGRRQGPRASARHSSPSTTRCSAGRAWVPSPHPTIPTS